jgi:hypothetical protein
LWLLAYFEIYNEQYGIRWVGHVVRMVARYTCRVLGEKPEGRGSPGRPCKEGRIILKYFFKK